MSFRGQSLRRLEDARFLTGRARYIEDIDVPGQAWMHVVRSPHAHAAIERIDTTAAQAMPGVAGVFTAEDLRDLGPLPCTVPVASVAPMIVPPRFALAADRVRHVGDPVAFVVAETRVAARDAAECVGVDYRVLPSVVDAPAALLHGAPQALGSGARQSVVPVPEGRRGGGARGDAGCRACGRTGTGQQPHRHLGDGTTRRDRAARRRWVPPDILRRRRACACVPSLPTACFACRTSKCECPARMSAAASA